MGVRIPSGPLTLLIFKRLVSVIDKWLDKKRGFPATNGSPFYFIDDLMNQVKLTLLIFFAIK